MRAFSLFRGWRRAHAYRLCLALALAVFAELFVLQVRALGLSVAAGLAMVAALTTGAVLGARVLHVIERWSVYRRCPRRAWARGEAGASLFGGICMACGLGIPIIVFTGLPLGTMLDAVAIAAMAALPFGRIGCRLHGCCGGRSRRVPTQLVEALFAAAMVPVLVHVADASRPGLAFSTAAAVYSGFRLSFDFLRRDAAERGLTASQRVAIAVGGLSLGLALVL